MTQKLQFTYKGHEPFYQEIQNEVYNYLDLNKFSRYANLYIWLKAIFFLMVALIAYYYMLNLKVSPLLLLILAIIYGISCLLLAINIGHDAAHRCVSPHLWVNRVILTVSFSLLGVSGYLWQLRHNQSHHIFPNVNGCDIDIDENPFLRLSPNHKRKFYQRYQHLYAPFIYWLVSLQTIFWQDFVYLFKKELANMRNISHKTKEYIIFIATKLFYFTISLVLPIYFISIPWWQVIVGYLIVNFIVSILFVLLLIGTHFAAENEFPEISESGKIKGSWASHALATSLDWNPYSKFANFMVGGANTHAAHHLFPGVTHAHYRKITSIIDNVMNKYDMKYKQTSLINMINSHFIFLKKMSID